MEPIPVKQYDFNDREVWLADPLSAALLERLQTDGCVVESREYLKPIFRWMKAGGKAYNANRAFDFAEWITRITTSKCESLGINTQPHVSPQYAYNTLITMSQRASDAASALRAFDCLKRYNYSPDVFSYTALLDVVGRKSNLGIIKALDIYNEMLSSRNYPNIVTQVTMLRLVGMPHNMLSANLLARTGFACNEDIVLKLLNDARSLATNISSLDVSIYNNALSAAGRLKSLTLANTLLSMMLTDNVVLLDLSCRILGKVAFVIGDEFHRRQQIVRDWTTAEYLTTEQEENVLGKLQDRYNLGALMAGGSKNKQLQQQNAFTNKMPSYSGNHYC
jgi:hypothetical protein